MPILSCVACRCGRHSIATRAESGTSLTRQDGEGMMLQGKTAIVTGAARGLGRDFVRVLSEAGAKVVAADLNDCAETVAAAAGEVLAVRLDVTDMASVQ